MKNLFGITLALLLFPGISFSQEKEKENKYKHLIPEIHGTVRGKYEYQPEIESGRFQVRNARFSLTGDVHRLAGYKLEVDLSDQGKMRMLDAFAQIRPVKGAAFNIGQMRVPFTIDAHRSPHSQYFANRSFIAKQVGDVRDVGASLGYDFNTLKVPIIIEAGLYNGKGIVDQKEWTKDINYSAKAQFFPCKGYNITLSTQKTTPGKYSMFMHDIGTYIEFRNFHIEAEYLFKYYEDNIYKKVHAFNGFVNYDIPLKKVFSKISVLCRYDMMTDHWDGVTYELATENNQEIQKVTTTDSARQRITAGTTLSLSKPFRADIRLNYEKYFYEKDAFRDESEQDKFCFEVMIRF